MVSLYRSLAVVLLVGAVGTCSGSSSGGSGLAGAALVGEDVIPLAKAKGWRAEFIEDLNFPSPVLEIAFDRATAERAWDENVPGDLEPHGNPAEPGVHGSLDDINFETHVLAVWTSGESGSCPESVVGISRRVDDRIDIRIHARGAGCTDDYSYYRMALAVDRRLVPEAQDLPGEAMQGAGRVLVVEYPFRSET